MIFFNLDTFFLIFNNLSDLRRRNSSIIKNGEAAYNVHALKKIYFLKFDT